MRRHLHAEQLLPAGIALFIFALTTFARVSYAGADPQLSLVVTQSILEHGTITLDAYRGNLELVQSFATLVDGGMIQPINGHYYYLFPTGPSVLALPAVFVANLLGKDMTVFADNQWVQNLLAGALCAATFLLIYAIARCYLRRAASLVIATITVLGSALVSTMGTAYWNTDFAVVFVLLALWLIARYDTGRDDSLHPLLLGLFLFGAYFSRPTTAIFIALTLLYLLFTNRRAFLKAAAVSGLLLGAFLLWSRAEYGTWFPLYYRPGRLQAVQHGLGRAILGLLLSPSRGLLVYSPFFAVTLAVAVWQWRALRHKAWFWLALIWFALHLPIPGRATRWWGGHSFGPRMLTEVIPALVLLTIFGWDALRRYTRPGTRHVVAGAFVVLGLFGIYVNSFRGLYSHNPSRWNTMPNVDAHPEYLFDWRYPQFLATAESINARYEAFLREQLAAGKMTLPVTRPGQPISPTSENALFLGWLPPQGDVRWSEILAPGVLLRLDDPAGQIHHLTLTVHARHQETVAVRINGTTVGQLTVGPDPQTHTLPLDDAPLHNGINEITLAMDGLFLPGAGYLHRPHLALHSLEFDAD